MAASIPGGSNGRDAFRGFVASLEANETLDAVYLQDYDFRRRAVCSGGRWHVPEGLGLGLGLGPIRERPSEGDVRRLFQHVLHCPATIPWPAFTS